jgi:hypothetical protein
MRLQPPCHSESALAVRNLLFSADGAEASLGAGWHLADYTDASRRGKIPAQAELGRGTLETGNERDSPGHPPIRALLVYTDNLCQKHVKLLSAVDLLRHGERFLVANGRVQERIGNLSRCTIEMLHRIFE